MSGTIKIDGGAIVVDTNNDVYFDKLNNNQVPVKVEGRLTADGSIAMLSVENWGNLVGKNIVYFKREDGGALEVQINYRLTQMITYWLIMANI